jgi:hypothetical protein
MDIVDGYEVRKYEVLVVLLGSTKVLQYMYFKQRQANLASDTPTIGFAAQPMTGMLGTCIALRVS